MLNIFGTFVATRLSSYCESPSELHKINPWLIQELISLWKEPMMMLEFFTWTFELLKRSLEVPVLSNESGIRIILHFFWQIHQTSGSGLNKTARPFQHLLVILFSICPSLFVRLKTLEKLFVLLFDNVIIHNIQHSSWQLNPFGNFTFAIFNILKL